MNLPEGIPNRKPDILAKILATTRQGLQLSRSYIAELEARAEPLAAPPSLRSAIRTERVGVIAEIKRRSPSAGAINPGLDPLALARAYERGGAAAVSVLTEGPHFGGSLADLAEVGSAVRIPKLRKDFILDRVQLLEARVAGASAALLIVRALSQTELSSLIADAMALGLETLVEAHDASELTRALDAGAQIVGINARNLDNFSMDRDAALRLIEMIPPSIAAVAESGMSSVEDVERAASAGADAVLIGGALASAADPEGLTHLLSRVMRRSR